MRVVAHFLDGRVLKGESLDIDAGRPICHIIPRPPGQRVRVELADLKALYMVRSFAGDPARDDIDWLADGDPRRRGAHAVELLFRDGERLAGLTIHYPPARDFFFLLPADPNSNNQRILVNGAAVAEMHWGQAPEVAGPAT